MSGAFKSGVMGGFMGFLMSALSNYYVLPMPSTLAGVAIGNGISGLISGFMGGFMGVLIDARQRRRRLASSSKLQQGSSALDGGVVRSIGR